MTACTYPARRPSGGGDRRGATLPGMEALGVTGQAGLGAGRAVVSLHGHPRSHRVRVEVAVKTLVIVLVIVVVLVVIAALLVPKLRRFLNHTEETVRTHAQWALEKLTNSNR